MPRRNPLSCAFAAVSLILFLLDWAALHDVIKGNEPDLYLEYAMLVLSAVVFGLMLFLHLRVNVISKID